MTCHVFHVQIFREEIIEISSNITNASVVCTWYMWHAPLSLRRFVISSSSCVINEYSFTLTEGCVEIEQMEDCKVHDSIIAQSTDQLKLACSHIFVVSEESMKFLEGNLNPQIDEDCFVTVT